jgi:hypothetical protein
MTPKQTWRDASRAELANGSCPDCGSPVAGGHTASCETWISRSQAAKLTAEAVAAVERPLRAHIDTLTAAAGITALEQALLELEMRAHIDAMTTAVEGLDEPFQWLVDNYPKAMREMPTHVFRRFGEARALLARR